MSLEDIIKLRKPGKRGGRGRGTGGRGGGGRGGGQQQTRGGGGGRTPRGGGAGGGATRRQSRGGARPTPYSRVILSQCNLFVRFNICKRCIGSSGGK